MDRTSDRPPTTAASPKPVERNQRPDVTSVDGCADESTNLSRENGKTTSGTPMTSPDVKSTVAIELSDDEVDEADADGRLATKTVDLLGSDIKALSLFDGASSSAQDQALLGRGPIEGVPTRWATTSPSRPDVSVYGGNTTHASIQNEHQSSFPWPAQFVAAAAAAAKAAAAGRSPEIAVATVLPQQQNKRKTLPLDDERAMFHRTPLMQTVHVSCGLPQQQQQHQSFVMPPMACQLSTNQPVFGDYRQAVKFQRCIDPQENDELLATSGILANNQPPGLQFNPIANSGCSSMNMAADLIHQLPTVHCVGVPFDGGCNGVAASWNVAPCDVVIDPLLPQLPMQYMHIEIDASNEKRMNDQGWPKDPCLDDEDVLDTATLNHAAKVVGMPEYTIPEADFAPSSNRRLLPVEPIQSQHCAASTTLMQRTDDAVAAAATASSFAIPHHAVRHQSAHPSNDVLWSSGSLGGSRHQTGYDLQLSDDDIQLTSPRSAQSPADSGIADICSQPSPSSSVGGSHVASSSPPTHQSLLAEFPVLSPSAKLPSSPPRAEVFPPSDRRVTCISSTAKQQSSVGVDVCGGLSPDSVVLSSVPDTDVAELNDDFFSSFVAEIGRQNPVWNNCPRAIDSASAWKGVRLSAAPSTQVSPVSNYVELYRCVSV
jgi:hypothetical protein